LGVNYQLFSNGFAAPDARDRLELPWQKWFVQFVENLQTAHFLCAFGMNEVSLYLGVLGARSVSSLSLIG
jgi:hypothetical protein